MKPGKKRFLLKERLHSGQNALNEEDLDRSETDRHFARFDPGEIEHVIHQI